MNPGKHNEQIMEDPIIVRMESEIYIDHQLDFDEDDGVVVQTSLTFASGDDAGEVFSPLSALVEEQIEYSRITGEYGYLYSLSHEFSRLSEKMREVAEGIEDSFSAIGDLFDMDEGDLQ